MPGISLGNFVTSITRERFFPKVIDNIFEGNVLFNRLRGSARPWTGGYRLNIPTTVQDRTSLGSYSGFDTFITTQENVRRNFTIDPSEYYASIPIAGIQKAVNKGPEAIVDLMTAEFSDVGRALSEEMGEDMYLDGTGNDNKDLAGLNYHIDDATDVVTYQGLSRNTFTNLRATRTAQSGAIAISDLATDWDASQRGSDHPTIGITTPAVFSILERLIINRSNLPTGQIATPPNVPAAQTPGAGQGIALGFTAIWYRGAPFIADEKCTANNIFTINERHLFLYQIEHDSLFVEASKEGFGWTGWKKSANQNAIISQLLWAGQLVGDSPRTMARRTGVTS